MTNSRTISGIICLAAICVPVVIAPFRITQSLAFVHDMENRTPNAFPQVNSASNFIDSTWWASVSGAIEDRVPFREQMITLNKKINPARSGDRMSRKVERGLVIKNDHWLFFRKSITTDYGTLQETQHALESMQALVDAGGFSADLFVLVAPNKVTIYPEMLEQSSQSTFAQTLDQRQLLESWFADPGYSYRIDTWSPMRRAKANTTELVYEPAGSHYNSKGALVFAKALIDTLNPTLWDHSQIVEEWTKTEIPDIAKVTGDWDIKETNTRLQIHRSDIEIVELWDNDQPVINPNFLSINHTAKYGRKRVKNRAVSGQLIPGKTLILYDSFIEHYLLPTLAQYFEEVEFIHLGTTNATEFQDALNTHDRVIFACAERHIIRRATEFFGAP
ncbi:hypothetical protein COB72_10020 [bacterium]|nr:MAG: hypothetical protein COB72_10020 [bacterium]